MELTNPRFCTCLTIGKYKKWSGIYWLLELSFPTPLYFVFILFIFLYFPNKHLQNHLDHSPTNKGHLILRPYCNLKGFSPNQVEMIHPSAMFFTTMPYLFPYQSNTLYKFVHRTLLLSHMVLFLYVTSHNTFSSSKKIKIKSISASNICESLNEHNLPVNFDVIYCNHVDISNIIKNSLTKKIISLSQPYAYTFFYYYVLIITMSIFSMLLIGLNFIVCFIMIQFHK